MTLTGTSYDDSSDEDPLLCLAEEVENEKDTSERQRSPTTCEQPKDAQLLELEALRQRHQRLRRLKLENEKARLEAEIRQMEEEGSKPDMQPEISRDYNHSIFAKTEATDALVREVTTKTSQIIAQTSLKRKLPPPDFYGSKGLEASFTEKMSDKRSCYLKEAAIHNRPKAKSFGQASSDPMSPRLPSPNIRSKGKQATVSENAVEGYSGLRLRDRQVSVTDMQTRMLGRRMVPLHRIMQDMSGDDIVGDWVTIGVIAEKSSPRTSLKGGKYCVIKLTDLDKSVVNVFLFKKSFERHWKELVGSVVALLNPKILLPNEKGRLVGLNVDNEDKWMKIGMSQDIGFCEAMKNEHDRCARVLNIRHSKHCEEHAVELFKKARLKRQEFLAGNAVFALGDPKDTSKKRRKLAATDTYLFPGGQALSTGESGLQVLQACKPGRKLKPEEEKELAGMLDTHTPGARYLRIARHLLKGSKDPPPDRKKSEPKTVFTPEAMSRMGFDPVTGRDFIAAAPSHNKLVPVMADAQVTISKPSNDGMIELELSSDED
ncbi:uncharacterized protein SPPG_00941 [Spizellomyces punctatus DAOM BR117]|uniref:Uncharacterized protein n=1 Tax=Spizellomyces punctatus (strain DAOM BR117) TaxID=645134 RepID=A0A0L0HQW0_SPIPD|nr:uncharacterized protein SPPG_00941 [Spizellomyces punctatus DAOM BR117]KND03458.1 hypothetical protein SPPG_00941 [Spizellomyces punctatus DAOM BR117]|eukprot:XP_016611497.1 hypothetical protein SPPG_00941 [Spizellomyces punctatus DAOM BR117]